MAQRAVSYEPLITETLEFERSELSSTQVARIEDTHKLMASFALETSKKPLHADEIASKYFAQYTKLLSESLPESEDLLWDAYFAVVALYALHFSESISATISNFREFSEIYGGSAPEDRPRCTDDSFWPLLETLLVGLEIEEALDVLNQGFEGSDAPAEVFATVSELANNLRQYPGLEQSCTQQDFWNFRRSILAVADRANTLPLPWGPSIARACAILTGRQTSAARHWTQAVVAQYAFLNPDPNEWPQYVRSVPDAKPALGGDAPEWECCVARAMDNRAFSAILDLQRLDTCSAVVVAEFYFQTNRLPIPFASTPSLREYLGLSHALECLAVPGLVVTGVDMLINMQTPYAREILEAALPQLGLEAPETRHDVLKLTAELGLVDARAKFNVKVAEYELEQLNYVEALKRFYDAGDFKGMRDTTWTAFESMLVNGVIEAAPETLEILRLQQPQDLSRPVAECVAPLAVLATVLYESSTSSSDTHALDQAVQALVSTKWIPSKYYPLIIACAQDVDNGATVAAMMRALQEWDISENRQEGIDLIEQSRESAPWAKDIDPQYTNDEIVNMLRRKLSEVFV